MLLIDNVTVVIRAAGERTEAICHNLLAQQIAEENIIVIREAPFAAALAASYRAGIERNRPWTLCIDADVLVRPTAVADLLHIGEEADENVFEVQGLVLDKLTGGPRPAGNHLYRTSLLSKALELVPLNEEDIRPEYYTLKAMKTLGYPWLQCPVLVGLHDFEQYYRDIFRKCYIHAHKHVKWLQWLLPYWRRVAHIDKDFQVALWGTAAGISAIKDVSVDINLFPESRIKALLPSVVDDWVEKTPLHNDFASQDVESLITTWQEPEEYLEMFPSRAGLGHRLQQKGLSGRVHEFWKENGYFRTALWLLGKSASRIGTKLHALSIAR